MFKGRHLAGRALVVAGVVAAMGLTVTSSASASVARQACTFKGAANWYPTGDTVEAEDLCGDGYAVRVSVYQLNRDQGGTYWQYTGIRAHDPSSADGSDMDAKNLLEGVRIRLHAYLINRNGTRCHRNFYRTPGDDYLNSGNGQSTTYIFFKC